MSSAGTVMAMIVSLKNNARAKKRAFDSWKENKFIIHKKNSPLVFKKVSDKDLKIIKKDIQRKAKNDRKRVAILTAIILIPVLIISYILVKNGLNKYTEDRLLEETERLNKIDEIKNQKEETILYFLNDGYKWLDRRNFKNAKIQFYEAYKIDHNDYRINFANAKVYVLDCVENSENCNTADKLVDGLIDRFGENEEINYLEELLKESN
ncbi:MAG: hypothetical protein GXO79_10375 [Chlorobi bacterium]|nr:hypothetical protein [Chlorobiota bacterium]